MYSKVKLGESLQDAEFLCLTVCLMTHNGQFAYKFIKDICLKVQSVKVDSVCLDL